MSRKKFQYLATFLGIGHRVKKVRKNLSQEAFGKILGGLSKSTISKFESDIMIPNMETLKKIADYGKVTIEWLLRGNYQPIRNAGTAAEPFTVPAAGRVESDLLAVVINVVEEVVTARRLKLPPHKKARLIALLYDHCQEYLKKPTCYMVEKYLLLVD
jgi:transcriptional regulator with XRE-family HTH domain